VRGLGFQGGGDILEGRLVVLLHGHLEEHLGLLQLAAQAAVLLQLIGEAGAFLEDRGAAFGIVPEAVGGDGGFELLEAVLLAREVKDSPGSVGAGP